jgi:homoserine dehydrogenase
MKTGIGIIGVGTVGSGVVEILESKIAYYKQELGLDLKIQQICAKTEDELSPYAQKGYAITTKVEDLFSNPDVSIVIELAGGYDLPLKWITAALNSKKHVVTANKALIAKYGHLLFPLAAKNNCHLLFEAAVGGGIPIIRALQESLTGNTVKSLRCIINGTCNYILTEMTEKGLGFASVLADAQKLGYAEADPTFDVDAIDSAHKLAILASLCSKKYINFENMHISGIREIEAVDIDSAKEMGYTLKLLGIFNQTEQGMDARVHPCLVPSNHLLASVSGVLNAVYIEANNLGPALFTGAGAGKLPTASAVVADVVSIARSMEVGLKPIPMGFYSQENPADLVPIESLFNKYYFRFTTRDEKGVLAAITSILSENGISIESIIQKNVKDPGHVNISVVTERCREAAVNNALLKIGALSSMSQHPKMIRFAE